MLKKVLIANRGEIAVRIIRACKELNIKTVAIYSEADKDALHTKLADEAVCVGPAQSSKSYLNIQNILEAACTTNCDSVHPGFGFLSENASFAKMCEESNLKFIGPSYKVIDMMGNKSNSKELMKNAKVPVVPGSDGCIENVKEAIECAKKIGYPVLLKASAGGGGKGIRKVEFESEMENAFNLVKQEAKVSFNDDAIYMEKFIVNPRHVEMQVLADEHGNVVHLGERDCSVQRRNQKVLEESPSMVLTDELRAKMGKAAIRAVKASGYTNAGTIEFLVDKDKNFYFMEMNTRVQVEHPVTEMITGTDIIKEQLRIAAGEPISCMDKVPFSPNGHAMEFRINAEDPDMDFRPCPGNITRFETPSGPGVRVETYIKEGSRISPYYDSMVAKLIVWGNDREECIARGKRALEEFRIEGIKTTIPFHQKVLDMDAFVEGRVYTDFIETEMGDE